MHSAVRGRRGLLPTDADEAVGLDGVAAWPLW